MSQQPQDVWQTIQWNGWGQKNRQLALSTSNPDIVMHPNGKPLPKFIPFIYQILENARQAGGLNKTPSKSLNEVIEQIPAPVINKAFLAELGSLLRGNQIQTDAEARVCHTVGKNYRDLWRMRRGILERPPDVILYPESHSDCEKIMQCCVKHSVCLIPFGGGTNVVGAVEPDPSEARMVASVDMRRMNRMLSLDAKGKHAVFEVGVLGPALEKQLEVHGFMFGHDPDSFEHSTLGGWIAARSSGAASNKYGEMEQMVLALKVVTPVGTVETPMCVRAVGPDLKELFLGSEGVFGIITEATVKVHARPEARHYEGWLLPNFSESIAVAYELTDRDIQPAIVRSYDHDETQLSMALSFPKGPFMEAMSSGIKFYLKHCKSFELEKLSMMIIGFEGSKQLVATQRSLVKEVMRRHNGFCVGPSAGANWQSRKYDLPLVRDFTLDNGMWADVLETTVDYGRLIGAWEDIKASVHAVWRAANREGWIGCHSAHQYRSGACIYFTFASLQYDEDDIGFFLKLKTAATEAILRNGGTLSHHHGIGFEHVPWLNRYLGSVGLETLQSIKKALDPTCVCNPGKIFPPYIENKSLSPEEREKQQRARMMFFRMGVAKL